MGPADRAPRCALPQDLVARGHGRPRDPVDRHTLCRSYAGTTVSAVGRLSRVRGRPTPREEPCSPRCWSPTAARSRSGRSGLRRAGRQDGRGLPVRGPQLDPPAEGRRGLPDRRARATRSAPTSTSTRSSGRRVEAGADAVYPGYGFLSENPDLAEACAAAGITFVGPPADGAGAGRQQGRAPSPPPRAAGLPDPAQSVPPSTDVDELIAAADEIGFPIFVKAVAGGGGRGMRRVERPDGPAARRSRPRCARRSPRSATRRCSSSRRCVDPRHIEVQILADGDGQRRCTSSSATARCSGGTRRSSRSRRRRTSTRTCAQRMCADAVAFAKADRLRQRRHGRVPGRPRRRAGVRLHRDEPAHPGRAHGHRGGHRRRPRPGPAADRRRRDAGRPRPVPGQRSRSAAPPCSAGSPPRTRPTASARTPARSPPTARPAAPGVRLDGGTVLLRRRGQRRTSTRCWSS